MPKVLKMPKNPPSGASQTTAFQRTQQHAKSEDTSAPDDGPTSTNFFTNLFPFLAQRTAALDTALSAIVGLGMSKYASL